MEKCFKNRQEALSSNKGKILKHKFRFDIGYGLSSYMKVVLALFGLSSLNVKATMILALGYGLFCYFFGWFWIRYGWYETSLEIGNQFNFFVSELRKKQKV